MTVADILRQLRSEAVVKMASGSWKWQQPYAVANYVATARPSGDIVWRAIGHALRRKVSEPQLRRTGEWHDLPHGSLHGKMVPRSVAIQAVGISRVRSIEGRGFRFESAQPAHPERIIAESERYSYYAGLRYGVDLQNTGD